MLDVVLGLELHFWRVDTIDHAFRTHHWVLLQLFH